MVVDRYAFSGVAYTAAKEVVRTVVVLETVFMCVMLLIQVCPLSWCKAPDIGLPAPDVVFYLKLPPEAAQERAVYGNERYERVAFQKKVEGQFDLLKGPEWHELDASKDIETLHAEISTITDSVIRENKNSPIGKLWT